MSALALVGRPGAFEGYASLFGVPDLSRDTVMRGAFAKSLAVKRPVRLLWQHDPAEPVGIWTAIREDARGLFCQGQLNLEVQRGRELQALLRQGAVDGLSIGFKTLRSRRDPATGGRQLIDVDLWEISLVSFPLLPEARVSAAKARTLSPPGARMPRARASFHHQSQTTPKAR